MAIGCEPKCFEVWRVSQGFEVLGALTAIGFEAFGSKGLGLNVLGSRAVDLRVHGSKP